MLSNQRGIIYQVTHDDMWQIIILTILFIAINVSNPPPRLPRSPSLLVSAHSSPSLMIEDLQAERVESPYKKVSLTLKQAEINNKRNYFRPLNKGSLET